MNIYCKSVYISLQEQKTFCKYFSEGYANLIFLICFMNKLSSFFFPFIWIKMFKQSLFFYQKKNLVSCFQLL